MSAEEATPMKAAEAEEQAAVQAAATPAEPAPAAVTPAAAAPAATPAAAPAAAAPAATGVTVESEAKPPKKNKLAFLPKVLIDTLTHQLDQTKIVSN